MKGDERFRKGSVYDLKALKTQSKKKKTQILKSFRDNKFRAKLESVHFHFLKAVVCKVVGHVSSFAMIIYLFPALNLTVKKYSTNRGPTCANLKR